MTDRRWYVVRTYTDRGQRTSEAYYTLAEAQRAAKAEQADPDTTKAMVLRVAPPTTPYDGETLGRIYNIHNATTMSRIGTALAVYADTDGQE